MSTSKAFATAHSIDSFTTSLAWPFARPFPEYNSATYPQNKSHIQGFSTCIQIPWGMSIPRQQHKTNTDTSEPLVGSPLSQALSSFPLHWTLILSRWLLPTSTTRNEYTLNLPHASHILWIAVPVFDCLSMFAAAGPGLWNSLHHTWKRRTYHTIDYGSC